MLHEVMQYFGLAKEFQNAGYFETEASQKLCEELQIAIEAGHLIALSAIQGSGKTKTCRYIRDTLQKNRKILVATSLAVDKDRVTLSTLIDALFADLVVDKQFKVPAKAEIRERRLQELIKKRNKPVALFIDEAHDLHPKTLIGLKRLMEVVQDNSATFSIVLVGLPKLSVTLKRPALEEIGTRVRILTLETIVGQEKAFLEWMLTQCAQAEVKPTDIFTREAIHLLADKLKTPLQIIHYSWQALELAYKIGTKPVNPETVRAALAPDIQGMEASLVRQGFSEKVLCEILDVKPREIRAFLKGQLAPNRMYEIHNQLLGLGVLNLTA